MDDLSLKEKYSSEVSTLNALERSVATALVDTVLDFLLKSLNSDDFQSKLGEVMTKAKLNASAFKATVKFLLILFQGVLKDALSPTQLNNMLLSFNISESISSMITSIWEQKSSKLTTLLLSRSLESNKLIDMDWSFGVTASSDDFDQVGKTYLQVKFKVDSGSEGVKDIFFELSLDQFYSFLAELEKCKSFLDALAVA